MKKYYNSPDGSINRKIKKKAFGYGDHFSKKIYIFLRIHSNISSFLSIIAFFILQNNLISYHLLMLFPIVRYAKHINLCIEIIWETLMMCRLRL